MICIPNTYSTIRDLPFVGYPACQLKLPSYGSKDASPSLFLIHHFVHTYMQNSRTTGCIRTFHLFNDCSTIRDINFLG